MKKLQDNLAARIAASVILTVSFLLTLLSTAGIVLLASYQAYNDGGAQLRTSYLHAAGVQDRCWRDLSMSRRAIRIT